MATRSRAYLKQEFNDGERPTGADFADLMDSYLNKEDDQVRLDTNNNLTVPGGINLANTSTGQTGTLRFNGTQIEVFNGGTWNPVSGGGGAFTPVGAGPDVAYDGGNVGIGNFPTPPTHKLDVPLAANSGAAEQVLMGNMAVHNGQTAADDAAYISHEGVASDLRFALKQDGQANTTVNAGSGAQLILSQQGTTRLQITQIGNVTIVPATSASILGNTVIGSPIAGQERDLTVTRDLLVSGQASKPGGGTFEDSASDKRVKQDVKTLDAGLEEICKLKPVFYKFNGKGGTPKDGKEYVGLIAQEVEKVVPFMVKKSPLTGGEKEVPNMLTYNQTPLTFIMINAIRELTERVKKLEAQSAAKTKGKQ